MAKVLKWVAVLMVALLLLVVGAALALQHWLRTDDFRGRVERQASDALGVPLKLGRLSIDLWPLPAVAADDVQVLTRPAPLTIARVEARPDYPALLSGRLEIATLTVRKAVLPQTGIAAVGAAMQRRQKTAPSHAPAPPPAQGRGAVDLVPHRAVFDDITWIDEKGMRMTAGVQAELGSDGLLDEASFKIVQGRLAGTQGHIERAGAQWPLRVDIGGGHITGKLQLQAGKAGRQLLTGQLATENVEVAALTAPSKPLTGKLQAQTTLRAEYREPGQIGDVLATQTRFTVHNALVQGIDLQKAVQTVGLSHGGMTRLDALAGQVNTQGKAVHLTNLVATSGSLSATGNVSISPAKALSGRVNVDLASSRGALGVPLEVSGTVDEPSVMLTRGAMVGAAIGTLVLPGAGTAAGVGAGDRLGESLRGLFGK